MTQEDVDFILEATQDSMNEAIERLKRELIKVRTGKASPNLVSDLLVDYYGSKVPMKQVSNISTPDARTLTIQPWEKGMVGKIEKSIFEANLGVTPQNDGTLIRINIPPLTEQRRRDLVKTAKSLQEDAKVSVRNARRDAISEIKQGVKDGLSEDLGKRYEATIDELMKKYYDTTDKLLVAKEADIMKV